VAGGIGLGTAAVATPAAAAVATSAAAATATSAAEQLTIDASPFDLLPGLLHEWLHHLRIRPSHWKVRISLWVWRTQHHKNHGVHLSV